MWRRWWRRIRRRQSISSVAIATLPDILVSGESATVAGTSNAEGQTVTVTINGQTFGTDTVSGGAWSIAAAPTDAMKGNSVAVVATVAVAGGTASSTTHVLPSGIVAGFDARLGVDTRVSGPDTFATDITAQFPVGSEPVASQATAASQPAYDGATLDFDGSDDYMTLGAGLGAHTSHTFVAVLANTDIPSTSARYLFDSQTGRLALVIRDESGSPRLGWRDPAGTTYAAGEMSAGYQVVSWVLPSGGTGKVYTNGVEVVSGSYSAASMGTAPALGAAYSGGSYNWKGGVKALFAWPSALSDADRGIVQSALADVHGVTL